jgi:hypothetical protein
VVAAPLTVCPPLNGVEATAQWANSPPRTGLVIERGEEIHLAAGERLRVLAVSPFDEEDESPFGELLQVEAAWPRRHDSVDSVIACGSCD